jgi:hypothetical protein
MTQWIPVGWDFDGSTEAIRRLKGKKVRNKAALLGAVVFDPIRSAHQQNHDLPAGSIGFVANPHPNLQDLLIAVPTSSQPASSLDALSRSQGFKVLVVNAPTFRLQFEFEA